MNILIDICHPAHVHFFYHPIQILKQRGHQILVTSREKEMATELLDQLDIEHRVLSTLSGGALSLLRELGVRDWRLFNEARRFGAERLAAIGGIFIAHVGFVRRTPSIVFYDTENARLQNALTYPLASCVVVPDCYQSWVPKKRVIRYPGYHELSYLHPDYFSPDRGVAIENGLSEKGRTFLVRAVSWQANHDLGESGMTIDLLEKLVTQLAKHGKVLISSESELPPSLHPYRYKGRADAIHHLMAFCSGFFGESATMASECAVLGVPSVYAATTGRGYTDEQESRFGLVNNVRQLDLPSLQQAVDWLLAADQAVMAQSRAQLLEQTRDVALMVADIIEGHPQPLLDYHRQGVC